MSYPVGKAGAGEGAGAATGPTFCSRCSLALSRHAFFSSSPISVHSRCACVGCFELLPPTCARGVGVTKHAWRRHAATRRRGAARLRAQVLTEEAEAGRGACRARVLLCSPTLCGGRAQRCRTHQDRIRQALHHARISLAAHDSKLLPKYGNEPNNEPTKGRGGATV